MQTLRVVVFAVCTVLITMLFGAVLAPGARADQWDRKTIVTFSDSVEIPGVGPARGNLRLQIGR